MSKIIRVEPVPEYFSITWMLGDRCNYDCMYCPTELHSMTSKPHSLSAMQQVWKNIHEQTKHKNLPYKISFTGGEVTANKNFLPLVQWLRANFSEIAMISITTNGSASKRYYAKLANLVESISFSTHSEFIDEQKFFDKVKDVNSIMIRPKKSVHVNIMNEFWNIERINLYKKFLEEHNISYSVNRIDYTSQTREFPILQGTYNLGLI